MYEPKAIVSSYPYETAFTDPTTQGRAITIAPVCEIQYTWEKAQNKLSALNP
jgi:hypothetical protein